MIQACSGLGITSLHEHEIEIKQRYYSISPTIQPLLDEEIGRMLNLGVKTEDKPKDTTSIKQWIFEQA